VIVWFLPEPGVMEWEWEGGYVLPLPSHDPDQNNLVGEAVGGQAGVTISPIQFFERLLAIGQLAASGVLLADMTGDAVTDVREGRFVFSPIAQRPPIGPLPTGQTAQHSNRYPRTDLGNAEYFRDLYGHVVRWDEHRSDWLEWAGHRWARGGRAPEMAQRVARRRLDEAVLMAGSAPDRPEAVRWGLRSESKYLIDSALGLAKNMSGILVNTSDGWDSDPWLLGMPNGVIDLRTGLRRDGSPDDYITLQAGIPYHADAECPRWTRFLDEIFDGDQELVTFTRRALGYTLTGQVSEDCWFGCHGGGRNGKSTLFKAMGHVLGQYAYVAPMSLVQRTGQNRPDFQHAYLQNKRLVIASETSEGAVWDEEQLKKLSGRDILHAEIKHGAEFNFIPTHKLWFMFNHQPRVRDNSLGFWRRVRLIPFTQRFEGKADDKGLDQKLFNERAGILAWLVRACREWQREGLPIPTAVADASKQYQHNEDPIAEFIADHVLTTGPGFYLTDVYNLYRMWTKTTGITTLGRNRFGDHLVHHGFPRTTKKNKPYYSNGTLRYICICRTTPCTCLLPRMVAPSGTP
jgi:putative DNA primase/helicase